MTLVVKGNRDVNEQNKFIESTAVPGQAGVVILNPDGSNAGGGGGGASSADQSVFVPATTKGGISMGVYETTPETLTNNQAAAIGVDVNRNVKVTLATLLAGENLTTNRLNTEPIYSFLNITTNATTTVKSGPGTFAGFTVNNNGFTTAGTITIYDNTAASGTKVGTWTIPVQPPGTTLLATTFFPPALMLNASFATGLTIVTATTAPAADITVLYR